MELESDDVEWFNGVIKVNGWGEKGKKRRNLKLKSSDWTVNSLRRKSESLTSTKKAISLIIKRLNVRQNCPVQHLYNNFKKIILLFCQINATKSQSDFGSERSDFCCKRTQSRFKISPI